MTLPFSDSTRISSHYAKTPDNGSWRFQTLLPGRGLIIAYTRSWQNETWLAVHNFSASMQKFHYGAEDIELPYNTPIIVSNYGENEVEYGIGTLVLKPYETVVFQLH